MRTLACLIALVAACGAFVFGQPDQSPIRIALTKKVFVMDEPEDFIPTAQLIGDEIGAHIDRKIVVEPRGDQIGDIIDDLRSGKVQFVISDGLDFVRLRSGMIAAGVTAAPLQVRSIAAAGVVTDSKDLGLAGCTRALLVVRSETSVHTFADLRGERLVYSPQSEDACPMLFVEALVRAEGSLNREDFFSKVLRLDSDDACLLSLQFGSADVTCVHELVFLARGMVGGERLKGMEVIRKTEHYAAYLCFYLEGKVDEGLAEQIQEEMLKLHKAPRTRKLLEQIHVERFVPFDQKTLKPIEDLLKQAEGIDREKEATDAKTKSDRAMTSTGKQGSERKTADH